MKIARTITDARNWANSFTCTKEWTAQSCPHGNSTTILIKDKGIVTDSVMCCPNCWEQAKWIDKIQ